MAGSAREQAFWDEHVPSFGEWRREYESSPDPNTAAMLDALEPLEGRTVLDFACGAGVTSAWLAARGAKVTGLDISPASIHAAAEYCRAVGLDASFAVGDLECADLPVDRFDRIAGRYALHHTDCTVTVPILAARLVPGGTAAFVETMAINPILRVARRYLPGRLGIARYGTPDEQPLGREQLRLVGDAFGELEIAVRELTFFRILDRNVFRYRSRRVSSLCARIDDLLLHRVGVPSWSFHQVLVARRSGVDSPAPERYTETVRSE